MVSFAETLPWPVGPAYEYAEEQAAELSKEKLVIVAYLKKRRAFGMKFEELLKLENRLFEVHTKLARARVINMQALAKAYQHAEIVRDFRIQKFGNR